MKTTTVVTSLTRRTAARFMMIVASYVAPSINQLRVAVARKRKIFTRLAILEANLRRALTVAAIIAIGASAGPTPALAVVITVSNTADSGAGSLRAALASANNGDTVDATGVAGTITLTSGELLVTNSVTILGPGANLLAVDGNYPTTTNRVLHVSSNLVVSITGLSITNGFATGGFPAQAGGGIYNSHSSLTVSNCVVSGNSAVWGGGLYNDGEVSGNATLVVVRSIVSSNAAAQSGGGIYNDGELGLATLMIVSSTVSSNAAAQDGGGIFSDGISGSALSEIAHTAVNANTAGEGGGIRNDGLNGNAVLTIADSILGGNMAREGGAIYNNASVFPPLPGSATLTITNSLLSGNSVSGAGTFGSSGGAILNDCGWSGTATIKIISSTLSNNAAVWMGGALSSWVQNSGHSTIEINRSVLSSNTSAHWGGGVALSRASSSSSESLAISNSLFEGNMASTAGGGTALFQGSDSYTPVTIAGTTFMGNSTGTGGGIFSQGHTGGGGLLTVVSSTFSDNSATNTGGGIHLEQQFFGGGTIFGQINNSTFSGNSADKGGGLFTVVVNGGDVSTTVSHTTFSGNWATNGGSGIGVGRLSNMQINNTILNAGPLGESISNFNGTVTSLGYNLSSDTGGGVLTNATDLINTNPLLGPLQDNGGPTFTHELLTGSPAINAGNPAFDSNAFTPPLDFDQRGTGFPRVLGGRIDIGAFEFLPPPNTAPTVQCPVAGVFDCAPASGLSVQIHANVTDLDNGQTLTVTLKEGSATVDTQIAQPTPLNNAGVTFNPVTLLPGVHSLTIEVSDGIANGSCNTSVTINRDTTAPAAPTLANATGECSVTVSAPTATDTCAGTVTGTTSDPLTYSSQGTFTVHWTFSDGNGNSSTANQTVIVHDTIAPVANSQSVSAAQNMPKAITLSATDNCNPGLTYSIVTPPSHGGLTGTAPNLTYTPALNYAGPDSFRFKANDGVQDSSVATISIAVNHPPVAKPQAVLPLEDTAKAIALAATDADGNALTYSIVAGPLHGTLSGFNPNTGAVTYTPAADYYGPDGFTFKANDGTVDSNVAIVLIGVLPVNDAPSFTKGSNQTVQEDAGAQTVNGWATSISAGPANESGQAVNFLVSNNNNALFSVQPAVNANGRLTYTPAANAHGSVTVTVRIHDNGGTTPGGGIDTSPAQTFTISVIEVNDVPSFIKGANQSVQKRSTAVTSTVSNWATSIRAGPANESGQTVNFLVSNNNNGLFTTTGQPAIAANGTLSFTPKANTIGVATVTVRIHDNAGTANGGVDTSATQTFTITVHL